MKCEERGRFLTRKSVCFQNAAKRLPCSKQNLSAIHAAKGWVAKGRFRIVRVERRCQHKGLTSVVPALLPFQLDKHELSAPIRIGASLHYSFLPRSCIVRMTTRSRGAHKKEVAARLAVGCRSKGQYGSRNDCMKSDPMAIFAF